MRMTQPTPQQNFSAVPSNLCPECQGRLVHGAEYCLHCGERIDSAEEAHRKERRKQGLLTTIMTIFVALGALGILGIAVNQYLIEPVDSSIEFGENTRSVQKSCVQDSNRDEIAKKRRGGWTEIAAPAGQRCFERTN